MQFSTINKYMKGEASEPEVQEIFDWIESSPGNKREFLQYKNTWALTTLADGHQGNHEGKAFVRSIGKARRIRQELKIAAYAAAGLLLVGIGFLSRHLSEKWEEPQFVYQTGTRIDVPAGQMSNVVLPDGTTVQLNSGTTLNYSANFNSGKRVVTLEGEAFFDVAKDPSHPFLVKTKTLDFEVYGTSFNIQAYPDEHVLNATLVDGSLGVFSKNGDDVSTLEPRENLMYNNQTKAMEIKRVNTNMYTSWKQGLITFWNESLSAIALKLERWYNVEIIIQNKDLANELYIGTIMKNKPIDQILEVFRVTSSLKYRVVQRPDKPMLIYWE